MKRAFTDICAKAREFEPPAPWGGRDFAALEDWMQERGARGLRLSRDEDGNCFVSVFAHGHDWAVVVGSSDVEPMESALADAIGKAVGDVEAFERGELRRGDVVKIEIECPYCGGDLVEEPGRHGSVRGWRCPNCGE